ncbi:MAG: hypothetical protein KC910_08265 [Candidatus Eremiobacteraeota bacterium]|nr:hypothetical protein [Candidatus Eremiobacteraeota bacterium]
MKVGLTRLRETFRHLRPVRLNGLELDWSLNDDELLSTLVRHESSPLLFGAFSPERVMDDLEESGILASIRQRGYTDFHPDASSHVHFEDRFLLWGVHPRAEQPQMLMDIRTHRGQLEGCCPDSDQHYAMKALVWDWISLQDPMATFSRPSLPGQECPGLGVFRQATELMLRYVREMKLDALVAVPEYFHNAFLYSRAFRFFEAERQGEFEALVRDLMQLGLAEASRALDEGRVRQNGQPFAWRPAEMVLPLAKGVENHFQSVRYQARVAEVRTQRSYTHLPSRACDQPS